MTNPLINNSSLYEEAGAFSHLEVRYEQARKILWVNLRPRPRPCFNNTLLQELAQLMASLPKASVPIEFWVMSSGVRDVFNLGGDLAFFVKKIQDRDFDGLYAYAKLCVDLVYAIYSGFGQDIVTLALVEGSALGGGFEAALAHHRVVAQSDVKLGFPEIAFNLFPGMGAYSLVARKVTQKLAEQLIGSGTAHTAEWLYEEGLVDTIFEPGQGIETIHKLVDDIAPKLHGFKAMLRAQRRVNPVSYQELDDITRDWARSAMALAPENIAYMERLVLLQSRKVKMAKAT